jgi:hypothetical protein
VKNRKNEDVFIKSAEEAMASVEKTAGDITTQRHYFDSDYPGQVLV